MFLEDFDAEQISAEHELNSARYQKRLYTKLGFKNMLSLYGCIFDILKRKYVGIRIEILSKTPFLEADIKYLYTHFQASPTQYKCSFWLYSSTIKMIRMIGAYN